MSKSSDKRESIQRGLTRYKLTFSAVMPDRMRIPIWRKDDSGDWVKHADAQSALAAKDEELEAMRKALVQLWADSIQATADAAIIADKTYSLEFVTAWISSALGSLKSTLATKSAEIERLTRERDAAITMRNHFEDSGWNAQKLAQVQRLAVESALAASQARVAELEGALLERVAQITAHRACCGVEHDTSRGKLHGYCVVCGVPWPCEYAGTPPATLRAKTEGGG